MKLTITILITALMGTLYLLAKSQSPAGLLNEAAANRTSAIKEAQAMWR